MFDVCAKPMLVEATLDGKGRKTYLNRDVLVGGFAMGEQKRKIRKESGSRGGDDVVFPPSVDDGDGDDDDDDRARCDGGVVHLRITRHDRRRSSSKAATPNYKRTFLAPFVRDRAPRKRSSSLALSTFPRLLHPRLHLLLLLLLFLFVLLVSAPSFSCCPTASL